MAAGAGMIRLGSPGDPTAAWPTEAVRMHLPAEELGRRVPGGHGQVQGGRHRPGPRHRRGDVAEEIRAVIAAVPVPLVIDADALTALGDAAAARALLVEARARPSILTPHDGEYARIAGSAPGQDRLAAARGARRATGAVVLLKGPLTAVAAPDAACRPTSCWPRPVARAGHRRAAATSSRGSSAPSAPAGCRALEAAALAAHVHGRAASLGPSRGPGGRRPARLVAGLLSEWTWTDAGAALAWLAMRRCGWWRPCGR